MALFLPPLILALTAAAPAETAPCSLTVRFGSYAMGIDRGAAAAVERILAADPDVKSVSRRSSGFEGEYGLCVRTGSDEAAERLLGAITAALPDRPRGPILVKAGGRSFSAPRR
jgi:hypothetical protein